MDAGHLAGQLDYLRQLLPGVDAPRMVFSFFSFFSFFFFIFYWFRRLCLRRQRPACNIDLYPGPARKRHLMPGSKTRPQRR